MTRENADAPSPAELAIARVMHEAVRAWQTAHGQEPAPPWDQAPDWMVTSSVAAIRFRRDNPKAGSNAQHDQWMEEKLASGWTHGPVKDGAKKTHPLLVPYKQLPEVERRKDALVAAVIDSLSKKMK
jgi:RyR domain